MSKKPVSAYRRSDGTPVRAHDRRGSGGAARSDEAHAHAGTAAAHAEQAQRRAAASAAADALFEQVGRFDDWEAENVDLDEVRDVAAAHEGAGLRGAEARAERLADAFWRMRGLRDRFDRLRGTVVTADGGQQRQFDAWRSAEALAADDGPLRRAETDAREMWDSFVADAVAHRQRNA